MITYKIIQNQNAIVIDLTEDHFKQKIVSIHINILYTTYGFSIVSSIFPICVWIHDDKLKIYLISSHYLNVSVSGAVMVVW